MSAPTTNPAAGQRWWTIPPTDRRGLALIAATYVGMTAALTLVGLAIVHWWEPSRLGQAEADVNRWFEERRTDTWTTLSEWGSFLSDTLTKVVVCAVLLPVFLWMWRRWHDWTFLAGGLVLEVCIFVSAATLVGRDRPPVEQLDSAPTNSFPSGHIAASVVFYGGLYLLARRHTRNRVVLVAALVVAIGVPCIMVLSRLYRGMHYPTDAAGGIALGLVTLAVMTAAIDRTIDRTAHAALDPDRRREAAPPAGDGARAGRGDLVAP
jgi:undecaprenyl-diphosphatase